MDKRPIRLIELFAGIGSQAMALRNLGLEYETVAISEFNKHASASYVAIHGDVNNLGDITKIESLPECDLLTYSFPCQDLSIAGNRGGMERDSGTRSSLLWEVERLLHEYKESDRPLPKILLMENVDAILNVKNIDVFKDWIRILTELGYTSSYDVLNAKDYGMAQNRSRCFMVSAHGEAYFQFPRPIDLEYPLGYYLEDNVDDKYYLKDKEILTNPPRENQSNKDLIKTHQVNQIYKSNSPIYSTRGVSSCLNCTFVPYVITDESDTSTIRVLTERESWRLMGFTDEDFDKAAEVVSYPQLYLQAGNSIVVNVLEAIFKGIYIDQTFVKQPKLTDY